jgi:hypothetical protein
MKILLKRARPGGPIKVYGSVQATPESRRHEVIYIRSKNFRGWTCDCENFRFDKFAKGRNCKHIRAAREAAGRYATSVQ